MYNAQVGANSGCSSLLPTLKSSPRLGWCKDVRERRHVPLVSLERLLGLLGGRTVDFAKVDAQGADLRAIASAGPLLHRVASFSAEVVSDSCAPLYDGQRHPRLTQCTLSTACVRSCH
jgi:hypothetical protein